MNLVLKRFVFSIDTSPSYRAKFYWNSTIRKSARLIGILTFQEYDLVYSLGSIGVLDFTYPTFCFFFRERISSFLADGGRWNI